MLANPPGGDFHIDPSSPAIDAGTMLQAPMDDFDFELRPIGPRIDIGADEVLGDPTPLESCLIPEQPPRTIYVDENSTSTAPDGSFADPFLAIQDGVDDANPGDLVFVAPGTYVENVIISQGPLYLEGEGPGAAAIIDASAGTTEPNGIRIQQDVDTVVISNFRLEAAHVDDGVVAGVIIYGSSEERGIEICNNVFFGNDADVAPQDTSPLVVNNTFVNNEYGLYVAAGSQGTYRNNIFKDNTTAAIQVFTSNSTTTDYNLFHGNGSDLTGAAACAPGCMFGVDPMIVDIPGHDFHIMPASPAVDAGTMMLAPKYDFDFEMRPIGPDIDIGADEVHGDDPTPVESCVIPEGPIIYVDSTAGAGTPDGSLAFPYPTIQDAVDAANPGDVIEVAGGVYVENVVISQGPLSIIGGDPGAAAWIDASSGTTEPNGIRIQQDEDNIVIVNIGFTGAQIDGASGIIVYGSSAPRGIEICNNVIYDNDRGVSAQNTSPLVVNNTVVMNGIGLSAADSQGLFQNNIVKDNNIGLETFSTTSNFDYNLLHNNSLDIAGPGACMMCISGDPLLVNPPGGDFHIDPASPAVDAGTMMRAPTYDFDFEPRPMGPGNDIGADEVHGDEPPDVVYTIEQGGVTYQVTPIQGDVSVEEFYSYGSPDPASANTDQTLGEGSGLEESGASKLFLCYGISLIGYWPG